MRKIFFIIASVLAVFGVGFVIYASVTGLVFPWSDTVTGIIYGLYTVLVFAAYAFGCVKQTDKRTYVVFCIELLALFFLVISMVSHKSDGDSNWYLPAALLFICTGNISLIQMQKKKNEENKDEDK